VVIKAAAVADYRPREVAAQKLKKKSETMLLELERTPDILQYLGDHKEDQFLVGFAAETENLLPNAAAKLSGKHLDLLVANDLKEDGAGFGVDTNVAALLYPDGRQVKLPKMTKHELAGRILDEIKCLTAK
jgi:phosphopantothenoylcysteine decarboxylase/phosphopantothenate--cysteine ligase